MKKTSETILITGASSGFGRDMAETLAADAHKVFGGVRDLAGRNSAAAEALRGKGVEVLALDVTSDAEEELAMRWSGPRCGPIHVDANRRSVPARLLTCKTHSPGAVAAEHACSRLLPNLMPPSSGTVPFGLDFRAHGVNEQDALVDLFANTCLALRPFG